MDRHRRLKTLAAATIVALAATGCGDDEDAAVTTTTASTTTSTGQSGGNTVEVTAVNYEFQGVPATVAAGSRFALTNDADDEVHELLVALRIADGSDLSVEELLALPEEELGQHLVPGPPAMGLVAPPGDEGFRR